MNWHYQIVEFVEDTGSFATLAEVYMNEKGEPGFWCDVDLSYLKSADEVVQTVLMMLADLKRYQPIKYPEDFDVGLLPVAEKKEGSLYEPLPPNE